MSIVETWRFGRREGWNVALEGGGLCDSLVPHRLERETVLEVVLSRCGKVALGHRDVCAVVCTWRLSRRTP